MYHGDLDHEPEGDPVDRQCPRCSHWLHDTPELKADVLACPSEACEYIEEADAAETWLFPRRLQVWVTKTVWPHQWLASLCIGVVAALLIFTAIPEATTLGLLAVGGFATFLSVQWIGPHHHCSSCGYESIAHTEGFCGNCGEHLSTAISTVDPEADGLYTRAQEWVNDRLPAGIAWSGFFDIDLTSGQDRTHLLDRLLAGPRSLWARFFDVGVVVATVFQVASFGAIAYVLSQWLLDAQASSGGSGGEPTPLTLPAIDLLAAVLLLFATVAAISVFVHELGHALAGRFEGLPISELKLQFSFGLFALHGHVVAHDADASPRTDARVSAAGPFFSLALAGLSLLGHIALTGALPWPYSGMIGWSVAEVLTLSTFFSTLFVFNIASMFLNILPAGGTDGRLLDRAFLRWLRSYRDGQFDAPTEPLPKDEQRMEAD